jgi:hypothetical protein
MWPVRHVNESLVNATKILTQDTLIPHVEKLLTVKLCDESELAEHENVDVEHATLHGGLRNAKRFPHGRHWIRERVMP